MSESQVGEVISDGEETESQEETIRSQDSAVSCGLPRPVRGGTGPDGVVSSRAAQRRYLVEAASKEQAQLLTSGGSEEMTSPEKSNPQGIDLGGVSGRIDLCRLCVIMLLGLEGAQVAGLL